MKRFNSTSLFKMMYLMKCFPHSAGNIAAYKHLAINFFTVLQYFMETEQIYHYEPVVRQKVSK